MKTTNFNKLIRDRIGEIIENEGKKYEIVTLNVQSFRFELKKKLVEEANEAMKTSTKEDLLNELADVFEVSEALMKELEITKEELFARKREKLQKNGGFEKRLFLVSVTEKEDSEHE